MKNRRVEEKSGSWIFRRTIQLFLSCAVICVGILILSRFIHGEKDRSKMKTQNYTNATRKLYVSRIAKSLHRAIDYLNEFVEEVNTDSIFGARILEDILPPIIGTLKTCYRRKKFDKKMLKNLTELSTKTRRFVKQALKQASLKDPTFKLSSEMIGHSINWSVAIRKRHLPSYSFSIIELNYSNIEEKMPDGGCDHCVQMYFNTSKKCDVSEDCFDLMSENGFTRYSLTHQVLYFLIGLKIGCSSELNRLSVLRRGTTFDDVLNSLCLNVMKEALWLEEQQYPRKFRDIFMEQNFMCGLAGYDEFYKDDWLEKICSWQDISGCYKRNKNGTRTMIKEPYLSSSELSDIYSDTSTDEDTHMEEGKKRRKRTEKRMPLHCSGHQTSVAIAALASYLKHLSEILWKPCSET